MVQPSLTLDTRVVQTRTMPTGEIDHELMALDAKRGEVLGLDPIATVLWRMAKEPVTLAEMVDAAVADYDVDRDTAGRDITAFAAEMIETGLFERIA